MFDVYKSFDVVRDFLEDDSPLSNFGLPFLCKEDKNGEEWSRDIIIRSALKYAHIPKYNAAIFGTRENLKEIMPRVYFLSPLSCKHIKEKWRYDFFNGAHINFCPIEIDEDYKSFLTHFGALQVQFIGIINWREYRVKQLMFLRSKLRRSCKNDGTIRNIPLRFRVLG